MIDPIDQKNIDLKLLNNGFSSEKARGRRLAWFRIPAWGVGDPGFKSQRPHHKTQRPHSEILLFAFSEQFDIVKVAHIFKPSFHKFLSFNHTLCGG